MPLMHFTDTIWTANTKQTSTVVVNYVGRPPFQVAKKQIFPVQDTVFRAVGSARQISNNPEMYRIDIDMVAGEASIVGVWTGSQFNAEPEDQLTVCCFREPNEQPIDFTDLRLAPAGTYLPLVSPISGAPSAPHFMRFWAAPTEVDLVDPLKRAELSVAKKLNNVAQIDRGLNTYIPNLIPGTKYFLNYQIMSPSGIHNTFRQAPLPTFTTKSRTVTVTVHQLRVLNDGDAGDNTGEAEFRASIFKDGFVYDNAIWKIGTDDNQTPIVDDPVSRTVLHVGLSRTIPPTPGDYKVGVNAHGREFDGPSDELASNYPFGQSNDALWTPWYIKYKTGPDEANDVAKFWLQAESVPDSDGFHADTFAFEVEVEYAVRYV